MVTDDLVKTLDRFPWKLIMCFLLIFFTSMQVMMSIEQTGQYKRSIEAVFYKNFLLEDSEYNIEFDRQVNFFSYSEVKDHLLRSR